MNQHMPRSAPSGCESDAIAAVGVMRVGTAAVQCLHTGRGVICGLI